MLSAIAFNVASPALALTLIARSDVTAVLSRQLVAVVSALPTAQNVFTHANRYGRSETLARDMILVTTTLCLPVMLVIAAVLG